MATHTTVAGLHSCIDLGRDDAYGLMWIKVPRALVTAFAGVGGVQPLHPKGAGYLVPVINGVPLVPWRYAKDRATTVDDVAFGVSEVRRSLFEPVGQLGLELGEPGLGDAVLDQLSAEKRRRLRAHLEAIRALAADGHRIAVLAYASNPDALLRIYLGYADLGTDDRLVWAFREELPLPSAPIVPDQPAVVPAQRPAFDSGPLSEPVLQLRPRTRTRDTR
jgi:hypothetical protein